MHRRMFLGAATALATLPSVGSADEDGDAEPEPKTKTCEICGGEKPASMVDWTTVEPIEPLKADICRACQLVQDREPDRDECMQCGDEIGTGCYCEVEFPMGVSGLEARVAGYICGDCAEWIGTDIKYDSLDADPEASERLVEILDEEQRRMKQLEDSTEGSS